MVVFLGVAGTAVHDRSPAAELAGRRPTTTALDEVARAAAARLDPHDDLHATAAYRRRVAATLARRTLVRAAGAGRSDVGADMSAPEPVTVAEVAVTVNGIARRARVEARRTLAELLREDLGLTGTHLGCEHGVCGSCTVLLDGLPARSCLTLAVQAWGRAVTTVEGLADGDTLHPVQQGCLERHAFQCGFCTPGVLVTAAALLDRVPDPDEHQIRDALAGQPVPLHRLREHRRGRPPGGRAAEGALVPHPATSALSPRPGIAARSVLVLAVGTRQVLRPASLRATTLTRRSNHERCRMEH